MGLREALRIKVNEENCWIDKFTFEVYPEMYLKRNWYASNYGAFGLR
jgi:hypothetical protein